MLLRLGDEELVAAVCGDDSAPARDFLRRFDPAATRALQREADVATLCRHENGYPTALRDLHDPPAVLHVAGGLARLGELTAEPAATVVGTRRPSAYGVEVAADLGRELATAGVTVVSGLALGIDAAVHRGVVDAFGRGVAVLAGGADVPYPSRNRRLYARLRENGVVVSELPPGRRAYRWSFPARNRLMAALGVMTVVVEATAGSGTMITAEFATDLGREVGAVPGRVNARMAAGANQLLRDGATVVRGAGDVLDSLYGVGGAGRLRPSTALAAELGPELREVLEAVEAGDDAASIASGRQLTAAAVRTALGRLEVLGLVTRGGLGGYRRTLRP